MPYITKDARTKFESGLAALPPAENAGELNYLFTKLAQNYIKFRGKNYQAYNDVAGAALNFYTEMYRREVGPYENLKIESNGDVE